MIFNGTAIRRLGVLHQKCYTGLTGGPVDEYLPASVGGMGSIPDPEGSHRLWDG